MRSYFVFGLFAAMGCSQAVEPPSSTDDAGATLPEGSVADSASSVARSRDGGTTPTAKGVTLKARSLPDLIGLLQRAHVAAVEAGWCDGDGP